MNRKQFEGLSEFMDLISALDCAAEVASSLMDKATVVDVYGNRLKVPNVKDGEYILIPLTKGTR